MRFRLAFASLLFLLCGAAVAQAGVLEAATRDFLRATPKERNVHGVAWDCLAAADLMESGETRAARRLEQDASELAARAIRSRSDRAVIGWSNDKTHRACIAGRGSPCAGEKIVYAYQTGLALACLSDAARLLQKPEFLPPVRQAISYWNTLRAPAPCAGCIYFRISDSQEDRPRYVRNMNIFMAAGLAAYSRASGDTAYADQALAVVRSDLQDRTEGFRGYVGVLDSKASAHERERIENHLPSMALMLNRIGSGLGSPAARDHAEVVWRDWAQCNNRSCQTKGCAFWAADSKACKETVTAAHCAFRGRSPAARAACETYLGKVRSVGSFGIISLLQDKR